jgi:hypothetical protein
MTGPRRFVRLGLGYGPLILSAIWLTWVAVELGHIQRWYTAQGGAPFFRYPLVELIASGTALSAGFFAARTAKWVFAPIIAILVGLFILVLWVGSTR